MFEIMLKTDGRLAQLPEVHFFEQGDQLLTLAGLLEGMLDLKKLRPSRTALS